MIFQAKLVNTYIDNLIQLNDFCKTSPFFYFNLPPLYLCSFSPDLPSMQYIEKNPLKYKLQEEHKSYGQIYVSRLHAFPATSERMPKKIPERSNGWLVVSVSSNSAFTARTAKICKKSKYSQNFVNCNKKCSGLQKRKACISSNCSSTYSGPKSPHLQGKQ